LDVVWTGPSALSEAYITVVESDVPFAQDCLGDQFLLRAGEVFRLAAETGDLEPLGFDLHEWLRQVVADPVGTLGLEPLLQFEAEGGELRPGELLSAYPPFCTREAANGVALRAIPTAERLAFLAEFSAKTWAAGNGDRLRIKTQP
jgi:hypothetical protein